MTNLGDFMTGADADKMIIQVRQTPQGKINYEKLINVRSTLGALVLLSLAVAPFVRRYLRTREARRS